MNAIQVTLLVFAGIETLNMLELYFMQDNCVFNGPCIYRAWEKSKADPEVNALMRYLINWIAGIKMIVIGLVVVLVFTAPEQTLMLCAISMSFTIASFFWRMYPFMRKADRTGQIIPKGRSQMLGWMVGFLQLMIVFAIIVELVVGYGDAIAASIQTIFM